MKAAQTQFLVSIVVAIVMLAPASRILADVPLMHSKFLKEAAVTPETARATALKVAHGKIVAEELEKERGGSGLRYSFDVKVDDVTHEVGIDAKTGKVLENSIEGPNPD